MSGGPLTSHLEGLDAELVTLETELQKQGEWRTSDVTPGGPGRRAGDARDGAPETG